MTSQTYILKVNSFIKTIFIIFFLKEPFLRLLITVTPRKTRPRQNKQKYGKTNETTAIYGHVDINKVLAKQRKLTAK